MKSFSQTWYFMKHHEQLLNESTSSDDFDRVEFYLEYIKNLCPKGLEVKRQDDDIIITVSKRGDD